MPRYVRKADLEEETYQPDGVPVQAQPQSIEEQEETSSDRVATLLDLAAGDERAYVAVYRINKGVREYCRKYAPGEFEDGQFDMIRATFGSGEYELRLYGTHPENGKFVVRRLTRISMAEVKPGAELNAMPNGMNQIMQTIAAGQQQMLDALVAMKQQPQKDPMEEMTKMLSMMTMMREAMGLNQQQQAQQRSSIAEVVDAIKELRGAAAEVLPEKEEETGLMGMLPKVLDIVNQGQQAQQQAPQMPMHQPTGGAVLSPVTLPPGFAQAAPAHTPAHTPAETETDEDDDMNPFHALKLRGYAKRLVEYAAATAPVEEAAQFVYDNLPDPLIDIMETDSWFAVFCAAYPAVKPHRDYLQKVRDAALEMFNEQEPPQAA